jgi:predicted RNase H-like nuclease
MAGSLAGILRHRVALRSNQFLRLFLAVAVLRVIEGFDANSVMAVERREVHPELSFSLLNGAPLAHPKRLRAGSDERRAQLASVFDPGTIRAALALTASQRAKPDDVLDALLPGQTGNGKCSA